VRLQAFIPAFTRVLSADRDFQRIMQWVLLDEDPGRMKALADNVFRDLHIAVTDIARTLGKGFDTHLLTVSILGLVMMPYMAGHACRQLPSYRAEHESPDRRAEHVLAVLAGALSSPGMDSGTRKPARAARPRQA